MIVSFFKVERHSVIFVLQLCSRHNSGIHVVVLVVIDVKREAIHLGGECVGILHVVVIDEAQRYTVGTWGEVFKDALARGQGNGCQQGQKCPADGP